MITINPLFLLTKLSRGSKIFLVCSIISTYGLILYEFLPEYLFNPVYSVYYFLIPSIIVTISVTFLPRIVNRNSAQSQIGAVESSQSIIQTVSLNGQSQEVTEMNIENSNQAQKIEESVTVMSTQESNTMSSQVPAISENDVQNMVDQAVEPMKKEVTKVTENVKELRDNMSNMKSSIDNLTTSFETTLTDLKSFQAELTNPLNFMRKYFDSIDLKSLTDAPDAPIEEKSTKVESVSDPSISKVNIENSVTHQVEEKKSIENTRLEQEEQKINDSVESYPFKQILTGNLSLGKLMSTISLMEEILQTVGPDSVDFLIEQCKLMGLKLEDEHVIYNIINMINKSGLSVNETLAMLYKFGKLVGINDREADTLYAKLMMNHSKNHDSTITDSTINGRNR